MYDTNTAGVPNAHTAVGIVPVALRDRCRAFGQCGCASYLIKAQVLHIATKPSTGYDNERFVHIGAKYDLALLSVGIHVIDALLSSAEFGAMGICGVLITP